MTPADSAKLLELAPDATPDQIEARFLELRARLEEKTGQAPTPGLKEKYRAALAQITEAFETLTLAADGSSLPVLRRDAPQPHRAPAAPKAEGTGRSGQAVAPRPNASKKLLVLGAILLVLAGGGSWIVFSVVPGRSLATARAHAKVELQGWFTVHDGLINYDQAAVGMLAGLRAREQALAQANDAASARERRDLRNTIKAHEAFGKWLLDTLSTHPVRISRAKLEGLVEGGRGTELELEAAVVQYIKEVQQLDALIQERRPYQNEIARIEEARLGVDKGEPAAMSVLAAAMWFGSSMTEIDHAKAIDLWTRAARAGDSRAKDELGQRGLKW